MRGNIFASFDGIIIGLGKTHFTEPISCNTLFPHRPKQRFIAISIARDELERIESKDENDDSLTEENNLHKADQKFKYYEQEIAKATRTNTALRKKEVVDSLVNEIKLQATLKSDMVWTIQDIALGLLTIPNLIAMVFLWPKVRKATKEFFGTPRT